MSRAAAHSPARPPADAGLDLGVHPACGAGQFLAAWQFDRDAAQVRRARRLARDTLISWGLAELADVAEMVVSELATNALYHGAGSIRVCLVAGGGALRIEVHDDGYARPVRRRASADDERGRGLTLIDGLIAGYGGRHEVTSDRDGPGKTVSITLMISP